MIFPEIGSILLLSGKLTLIELCIESAFPEQRIVIALLNDMAVFHDKDQIGFPDR